MTPARLRPMAEADLIERARYYRRNAGDDVAARFFDAAIVALHAMERMPRVDSPRVGEVCDIPGLRVRRIPGFLCGWFYFARPEHVDVVRLLADSQDLAAILDDITEPTGRAVHPERSKLTSAVPTTPAVRPGADCHDQ